MHIASLMDKHKRTEFQWGVFDCCKFALESLQTLHNFNIYLEQYSTQIEARKVFKKRGGTFSDLLRGFGLVEKPASLAMRGDLVTIKNDDAWGAAIALVVGLQAMCPSDIGLKPVSRDRWLSAWSTPCQC
jgi:hypothetical protein